MMKKTPGQRKKRPPVRLGSVDTQALVDRLRELHTLGEDPQMERFPASEELFLVLLHTGRTADFLVQPANNPVNVRAEAALLRAKLWQYIREVADTHQLRAIEDGRNAGVPWDHFKESLCVTSKQGAYQKARRLKAEQLREAGEWRTPEVARAHEQRVAADERAERTRVSEQIQRWPLAERIGHMLVEHRAGFAVQGMSQYWLEEIADTVDDRTTATEQANFTGFIESFVRNAHQLAREHGQSITTTDEARHVLELATEFTSQQLPVVPRSQLS
ncbi:hypothetical protein [Streptomyces sp. MMBL 11-3]|uniref:hypothetical protein n=1 Tax=Streptomyces sp. MMBL 11-3 TaxID=3382639 RepID=UPI0039B44DD0